MIISYGLSLELTDCFLSIFPIFDCSLSWMILFAWPLWFSYSLNVLLLWYEVRLTRMICMCSWSDLLTYSVTGYFFTYSPFLLISFIFCLLFIEPLFVSVLHRYIFNFHVSTAWLIQYFSTLNLSLNYWINGL